MAVEAGLELIPALNKIDLPGAEPERVTAEIGELIGVGPDDVLAISAKTGAGIGESSSGSSQKCPRPPARPTARRAR